MANLVKGRLCLISFFVLLLSSCVKEDNIARQVLTLDLGENVSGFVSLNDIFDVKEWIVLDSCVEGIVSSADKIECDGECFYVLDKVKGKCVYRFDKAGRFLNKIGVQGKGHEEYVNIYDFTMDSANGKVLILAEASTVYVYDKNGDFVSHKKISDTRLWNIQYTGGGLLASTNHSTYTSGDNSFLLYEYDGDLNCVAKWNHVLPRYTDLPPMSSFVFQESDGLLSYIDQKQNRVFLYNSDKNDFCDYISLSFPHPRPASHYEDAMIFMDYDNQKKYDWLGEFLCGMDKFVATYFHDGKYCVSVSDANGKILKEGVLAGAMPRIFPLQHDEYIAALTPEMYNMDSSWKEYKIQPNRKIGGESNMLLVRLKLK